MYEIAVYLHATFPYTPEAPDFCDVNPSLERLVHTADKPRNPWSECVSTLTASCSILMRHHEKGSGQTQSGDAVVLRLLRGKELMSIIGWFEWNTLNEQNESEELEADAFLTSLAGNAFSAYSVGPALLLCILAYGATSSSFCCDAGKSTTAGPDDDDGDCCVCCSNSSGSTFF